MSASPWRERRARVVDPVLVALGTLYAAGAVHRAPTWAVDDAWIVVRYADHLAQLGRITWNLDGPPVEGFTSLSAVLVAALGALVHVPPMRVLVGMGIASFLLAGVLLVALGRALRAPAGVAGLLALVHLTTAEHVTHATSGLETEVFIGLGLGLLVALARAIGRPSRSVVPAALLALLLTLTRPEGMVPAALSLGLLVLARRGPARCRALITAAAAFVAPQLLVLVWRLATFGVPLPNTFYAKHGGWNLAHHRDLVFLLGGHVLDLAVASGAALVAARLAGARPRLGPRAGAVVAVATASLAAQWLAYARSVPIMDYARRFAVHDLPWVLALAVVALSLALRAVRVLPPKLAHASRAVLVLAAVGACLRGRAALPDEERRMAVYASSSRDMVEPLGAWILANTPAGATLAAYPDAGWTPTSTERHTLDFGKLNDPYLARQAKTSADVVRYFFDAAPDVFIVSQIARGKLYDEGADAIVADPRFAERYAIALTREGDGGIAYHLYTRRP